MAIRRYTTTDYSACRWILENRGADMKAPINSGSGGFLTLSMATRLELLNLVDGSPLTNVQEGGEVRLAGLGEKTANEAIRLGYPTLTVIP